MTETLIYGVDGLNPEKAKQLSEKGLMPNLKHLREREEAVDGEIESFVCDGYQTPHTGPMWTSIYTGLKPEEHGLKSGGWNDGDSKFHEMDTVWDKISDETDKEMVLYGMPMTYKAKPIQGEMVSGFVSTTLKSMWENCVYPETLLEKLPDNFIENTASYVAKVKTEGAKPDTDTEKFYEAVSDSERERALEFVKHYNEDSADIVAYGTTYADKIGHVAGIGDNKWTEKVYGEVDEVLGLLLETLKPEHVIIVSDHGFSEYSHDLQGYFLNTAGEEISSVFDFTPTLLDMYNLDYDKNDYGPVKKDGDITDQEKDDIKQQLEAMGYF